MSATPTDEIAIAAMTPVKDDSNQYDSCTRSPESDDPSPNPSYSETRHDSDEDVQKCFQNPEPARELVEQNLIDADNIGDTVFSKHWLFTTLMDLLKVVDKEDAVELSDNLQDELCKLWDMSMNQEVVGFLMKYDAVSLFMGAIGKSKSSRFTEICVGILGNMACVPEVCKEIGNNEMLVRMLLLLLDSPDTEILVEVMRLLRVCVSSIESSAWISAVKESTQVIDRVYFILQSSTSNALLRNTAEFVNELMDTDDEICSLWGSPYLVLGVLEAIKQTGTNASEILETFLHILQLTSTSQTGVEALVTYSGQVCVLILGYLMHICVDDIVGVGGREGIIGSALSILRVTFPVWDERESLLITDFQLIRCILKVLDVVYPKHQRLPHRPAGAARTRSGSMVNSINGDEFVSDENHERRKSDSASLVIGCHPRPDHSGSYDFDNSDIAKQNDDNGNKIENVQNEESSYTSEKSATVVMGKTDSENAFKKRSFSSESNVITKDCKDLTVDNSIKNKTLLTDNDIITVNNKNVISNVSVNNNKDLRNSVSFNDEDLIEVVSVNKDDLTDNTSVRTEGFMVGFAVTNSVEKSNLDEASRNAAEKEYAEVMTETLYEELQLTLGQIILTLVQLPDHVNDVIDQTKEEPSSSAAEVVAKIKTPMSLVYLDTLCDRGRLQYMLHTLRGVNDDAADMVGRLYSMAQRHELKRLCRIINDTICT